MRGCRIAEVRVSAKDEVPVRLRSPAPIFCAHSLAVKPSLDKRKIVGSTPTGRTIKINVFIFTTGWRIDETSHRHP